MNKVLEKSNFFKHLLNLKIFTCFYAFSKKLNFFHIKYNIKPFKLV